MARIQEGPAPEAFGKVPETAGHAASGIVAMDRTMLPAMMNGYSISCQ
jgi:hypothetical protein